MSEPIDIQDYRITAPILQQILRKMDREACLRLYLTSNWGQEAVKRYRKADFERFTVAKQDEAVLLKMIAPHPRKLDETMIKSIIFCESGKIRLWKGQLDDMKRLRYADREMVEFHEERIRKYTKIRELARRVKANWKYLHGDDKEQ